MARGKWLEPILRISHELCLHEKCSYARRATQAVVVYDIKECDTADGFFRAPILGQGFSKGVLCRAACEGGAIRCAHSTPESWCRSHAGF